MEKNAKKDRRQEMQPLDFKIRPDFKIWLTSILEKRNATIAIDIPNKKIKVFLDEN